MGSQGIRISQDLRLRTPSPTAALQDPIANFAVGDVYGMRLLRNIAVAIQNDTTSKLIVPVAVFHLPAVVKRTSTSSRRGDPTSGAFFVSSDSADSAASSIRETSSRHPLPIEPSQMIRCLDAGAADVLTSPLQKDRVFGLTTHAYRARKEATKENSNFLGAGRIRKRSWVGFDEGGKRYSYLRESM